MSHTTTCTHCGGTGRWQPWPSDEALLEELIEVFVRRGQIERTGEFRNGKTVYRGTEFFRAVKKLADEGDEGAATFIELSSGDDQAEILRRGDALSVRLGIPWPPVRSPWPQR